MAQIVADFKQIDVVAVNTTLGSHTHIVAGADNLTMTLPAAPAADEVYFIKNFNGANAQVTIAGNGNNIDGQASIVLDVPNAAIKVVYDAAVDAWFVF